MHHSMALETVPGDLPLLSCKKPVFWKQKYFNSRHTASFKFQNMMAGSNVTSGAFISILLLCKTSFAMSWFGNNTHSAHTQAWHKHTPHVNASFPCEFPRRQKQKAKTQGVRGMSIIMTLHFCSGEQEKNNA